MLKLKDHVAGKRHVIWDWNGTLLDDVDAVVKAMEEILSQHGLPSLTQVTYREIFCFPVVDYYRRLGFDFTKVPFEVLSDHFMAGYRRHAPTLALHRGARDLLAALREDGMRQSVLSAAKEDHL